MNSIYFHLSDGTVIETKGDTDDELIAKARKLRPVWLTFNTDNEKISIQKHHIVFIRIVEESENDVEGSESK